MAIKNGYLTDADEVGGKFGYSKNQIRLILDLDLNGIMSFDRTNYEDLTWDIMEDDTYFNSGSSSNVQFNESAQLVALDVDNTNVVYAADLTGVARDGTYTEDENNADTIVTFTAGTDSEDFAHSHSGFADIDGHYASLTLDTSYRDGSCTIMVDNFLKAGSSPYGLSTFTFTAFGITITRGSAGDAWNATGSDGTNSFTWNSTQYLRITKVAGRWKTEESSDGSSWNTITDYTDAGLGTSAPLVKLQMAGANVTTTTASFKLKEWSIQGTQSSGYYLSNSYTSSDDINSILALWDFTAGGAGSSVTVDVSADGGSNWETGLTNGDYQDITNTGSSFIIRLNINKDTGSVESPYFTDWISHLNTG